MTPRTGSGTGRPVSGPRGRVPAATLRRPRDRHAGTRAAATRTREGSSGHERLESAQPSRGDGGGGAGKKGAGPGSGERTYRHYGPVSGCCSRGVSAPAAGKLCPVVVVVVAEDEHRARGHCRARRRGPNGSLSLAHAPSSCARASQREGTSWSRGPTVRDVCRSAARAPMLYTGPSRVTSS